MNKTPFITEANAIREDFKGRTNFWVCHPDITNAKDLQICRAVLPPGEGHDFHRHPELEEAIYVLEGEVVQWVEKEKKTLKVGECAHIGRGLVHASFNESEEDAVILAILSPVSQKGPMTVDVFDEEPWTSLR
ncbi:MAG: cupin domain-containing protein [Roseibacillus sp.]